MLRESQGVASSSSGGHQGTNLCNSLYANLRAKEPVTLDGHKGDTKEEVREIQGVASSSSGGHQGTNLSIPCMQIRKEPVTLDVQVTIPALLGAGRKSGRG